jgi:hypothetical protein
MVSVFWITTYDDDGAGSLAIAILFPLLVLLANCLRVFVLDRLFPRYHRIVSILMAGLMGLAMPLLTARYFKAHYYNKCEHCEGLECVPECGG